MNAVLPTFHDISDISLLLSRSISLRLLPALSPSLPVSRMLFPPLFVSLPALLSLPSPLLSRPPCSLALALSLSLSLCLCLCLCVSFARCLSLSLFPFPLLQELARSPLSFKLKIHKMRLQDRFPFCSRCHQACASFFAQVL